MVMSKMLEEIRQQPSALAKTLNAELRSIEKLKLRLEKNRPKFIILAARGTSDNAAQFGRYLLEITTGIPVSLAAPSIYTLYQARVNCKDALVVAISQSGESTDTNLVLERARQQGAFTIGITNESGSTLAKIAEHVIHVHAGREKSVAATKTYTGQLLALYLRAYALGGPIKLIDLARVPDWTADALTLEKDVAGFDSAARPGAASKHVGDSTRNGSRIKPDSGAQPSTVRAWIGAGKGVPRCASSHGLATHWPGWHCSRRRPLWLGCPSRHPVPTTTARPPRLRLQSPRDDSAVNVSVPSSWRKKA